MPFSSPHSAMISPYTRDRIMPRALDAQERAALRAIDAATALIRAAVAAVKAAPLPDGHEVEGILPGFYDEADDMIDGWLADAAGAIRRAPVDEAQAEEDAVGAG